MEQIKKFFFSDRAMLALVVLNTISIFVGGFYPESYIFTILDSIFTVLFLLEVIVKVRNLSWKGYWKDGWNRFDFIITVLALPSLANLFMEGGIATNILLTMRVLRIFKSFRLFRFIPNIGSILKGIQLAIKASFVVAVGVTVLLLILSILTSALFGSFVPEYFGNPGIALYSTFRLFTVEGWFDIPDLIAARSSAAMAIVARVFFSIELFIGGILGMSLINSIFVDAAVSDNNDEVMAKLESIEKEIKELKKD